ncbi:FAST kinase domain-containing protein 1, mitochondrial-like isoform X2 [Lithobates pipiens]
MFRCSRILQFSQRLIQTCSNRSDALLKQMKHCRHEYQLFQLVGLNKPLLSDNHISFAFKLLLKIQTINGCLTLEEVHNHPEFIALRSLAEKKVRCMRNYYLVNILDSVTRLGVMGHHTLVQQLTVECWKRLESCDIRSLSKFSVHLQEQGIHLSPLLGKIANIVDKNLDNMQDLRILSILMNRLQSVCSTSLQHRMVAKAHSLIQGEELVDVHTMERILNFAERMGPINPSMKDKWVRIIVQQMKQADFKTFCFLLDRSLNLNNSEGLVMLKSRLQELSKLNVSTKDFTRICCILLPLTSGKTKERLENSLLGLIDGETNYKQLFRILRSMVTAKCRHPILIDNKLKASFIPRNIIAYTHALFLMSPGSVDEAIISKLDAVVLRCSLSQIIQMAADVIFWLLKNPQKKNNNLYKKMNTYTLGKIRNMENLDVLLEEMKDVIMEQRFQDVFVEATLDTCQHLLPQITYRNVAPLSKMIHFSRTRCTPILDKIAAETIANVPKLSQQELYTVLKTFSYLTYEPPNAEEFYNVCIQHYLANLHSMKPRHLAFLAYALCLSERLPEDLVRAIFNVDFLSRLDLELDDSPPLQCMRTKRCLMELNRALCIECPEYQIPWFHDRYFQQLQQTDGDHEKNIHHVIQHLLGHALGGIHYTRMFVVAPYNYSVDLECILDKNKNPISYVDLNLSEDDSKLQSGIGSKMQEDKPLPPGAQRVAVDFLSSKSYCRNSLHPSGQTAMKKRHLEILGYRVIQIPSTEWNSMKLGTVGRRINYLREKIFSDAF